MGKFIEKMKDALNTRANKKTGGYYVKGKLAHKGDSDPLLGYGENNMQYESDPELSSRHKEHR